MSDRMTPIPFDHLMNWVLAEHRQGSCFGLHRCYRADPSRYYEIFGRKLETPVGPAAGPHTQLAQNIVSAYVGGARFFELKTVQKIDGKDLPVSKPCILSDDEGYNCEWSTELTVPQAFEEYVKAWFVIKVISREWGLGSSSGFQFNMSVGYDLAGIKTEKVNTFIDGMIDASETKIFKECREWLLSHTDLFQQVNEDYIEHINADICNSATISTLHGCPPQEIEGIAEYLIREKKINTFVKCNPTLLGYDFARETLDRMGYDYISFTDVHFKGDLQYQDAVPMLKRLQALAEENGLLFGVKLTNTFPVDVKNSELPSTEMYMSGKPLFPLSMEVASRLSKDFGGSLRIAFSGGCDAFNIKSVVSAGIWPVTVATTLLKAGGYLRFIQMADLLMKDAPEPFRKVDCAAVEKIVHDAVTDVHHTKPLKPVPPRKNNRAVPLTDCFISPCTEKCPIHQDIMTYGRYCIYRQYDEAFRVIIDKNPLPFITGNICPHGCQTVCTRNYYETPVQIRANKLLAARNGYDKVIKELKPGKPNGKKVVIIGAGPAGIAASYFLGKNGCDVTVFDENGKAGGVVSNIIPSFRMSMEEIEKDISLSKAVGAKYVLNRRIEDVKKLMEEEGADAAVVCIGAHRNTSLKLEEGTALNALEFLQENKKNGGTSALGENVVVIGGGNTAMDTARAAKKNKSVKNVYLVYRRNRRYMPADEEELDMALRDGVIFKEFLSPVSLKNGKLICRKTVLGDPDSTGRRSVSETEETEEVPADTVIASIGEKVDGSFYERNGIAVTDRGFPKVNPETNETNIPHVYAAGDGLYGASVVVKAIADATAVSEAILGKKIGMKRESDTTEDLLYGKKGILREPDMSEGQCDNRCLTCDYICGNCTDVCPNRANVMLRVPGLKMQQILHIDSMCNECGNCMHFCPYDSAPYKDKFTLFRNEEDMADSKNDGFAFIGEAGEAKVRLGGMNLFYRVGGVPGNVGQDLAALIDTVWKDYHYLVL